MRFAFAGSFLFLVACSSGTTSTPASTSTTPTESAAPSTPATPEESSAPTPDVMTPDQCTGKGGTVVGDIGDGKVACPATAREIGKVRTGIEGGVCCVANT